MVDMKMSLFRSEVKLMEKVKQEWLDRAFNPKPFNREKARKAVEWLYKFSSLEKPIVIFFDSPLAIQYAANLIKYGKVGSQVDSQVYSQVRSQVYSQVRSQVYSQVDSQVYSQVRSQVYSQVDSQVYSQVDSQVYSQVYSQVDSQVYSQVDSQVRSQVNSQVRSQVNSQVNSQVLKEVFDRAWWGSAKDYGWCAWADFYQKIGLIKNKNLDDWLAFCDAGIYDCIQLKGFCFVSSVPKKICRDASNNLHNEKAPAVEWADGYKNYFLHGVALDLELGKKFVKGKLKVKDILALENQEVKRVLLETIGWEKALKQVQAVTLERTVEGELLEVDLKDEVQARQRARFLKVKDTSTNRKYVLRVPPTTKTVSEARAWTFEETNKLDFTEES